MTETPISLLIRLQTGKDLSAWGQLERIYKPLFHTWIARSGLQDADVDDLTQEALMYIVGAVREFKHNGRPGAFRTWLRQVLVNRLRQFWRDRNGRPIATGDSDFLDRVNNLEDPASAISRQWEQEHNEWVVHQARLLAQPHFKPTTWAAFELVVLKQREPREAAAELNVTVNVVLIAKSRVLKHLKDRYRELLE